jgi:hypothetical protein
VFTVRLRTLRPREGVGATSNSQGTPGRSSTQLSSIETASHPRRTLSTAVSGCGRFSSEATCAGCIIGNTRAPTRSEGTIGEPASAYRRSPSPPSTALIDSNSTPFSPRNSLTAAHEAHPGRQKSTTSGILSTFPCPNRRARDRGPVRLQSLHCSKLPQRAEWFEEYISRRAPLRRNLPSTGRQRVSLSILWPHAASVGTLPP